MLENFTSEIQRCTAGKRPEAAPGVIDCWQAAVDPIQPVTKHGSRQKGFMKRLAFFAFALSIATNAMAGELCSGSEMKIAPDMQIQESDFTLEASEDALERLAELSREPRTELSWFAEENALRFVKGWLLKKAAIEALEKNQGAEGIPEVRIFCEFLVNEAFYHD